MSATAKSAEIRIGVSACLLGEKVRYDGGHKNNRYVADVLGRFLTLVPVCPEVGVGMGIPRETVRLEGQASTPRMIAPRTGTDWTDRMNRWSRTTVRELTPQRLCGYVFKKNSPSCGVFRVKVYNEKGVPGDPGRGLFAAEFTRRNPLVPVEEEGRLNDARLRDNFLERVFAYHRLLDVFDGRWKRGDVIAFHAREKYLLMAHSPRHLKELGQLTAAIKRHRPGDFKAKYMELFMTAMALQATVRKHVGAMQHLAGYLRGHVAAEERRRVLASIEDYRQELVPLVVPMTLLKHYIELHDIAYVREQTYLNPHPRELMLRNHV